MQLRRILTVIVVLAGLAPIAVRADDPPERSLERRFADVVKPFLSENCTACHGERKKESKLDLSVYSSVDAVAKDHQVWERVEERLEAEEMPPEKAPGSPDRTTAAR